MTEATQRTSFDYVDSDPRLARLHRHRSEAALTSTSSTRTFCRRSRQQAHGTSTPLAAAPGRRLRWHQLHDKCAPEPPAPPGPGARRRRAPPRSAPAEREGRRPGPGLPTPGQKFAAGSRRGARGEHAAGRSRRTGAGQPQATDFFEAPVHTGAPRNGRERARTAASDTKRTQVRARQCPPVQFSSSPRALLPDWYAPSRFVPLVRAQSNATP